MFPTQAELVKEHKGKAYAIAREIRGEAPLLDLGKKVSTPQDLMIEELSLHRNRGSCMYLERQKRVQRFTFEYPSSLVNAGSTVNAVHSDQNAAASATSAAGGTSSTGMVDGKENYHTEIHISQGGSKNAPNVPEKSAKVLQMKMALNPGAIAPGYTGPLKEIPYERFNSTAIPKSYRSPWLEEENVETTVSVQEELPPITQTPLTVTFRSHNRAPIPFGSLSVLDSTAAPTIFEELQAQIEESVSGLELMCQRPSFNRAPRGWAMKYIPETADL
ncbi:myozenin-3 [Rhinophrynus dorsalis]